MPTRAESTGRKEKKRTRAKGMYVAVAVLQAVGGWRGEDDWHTQSAPR